MNLIGEKYGYLTVIKKGETKIKYTKGGKKYSYQYWVCDCDCGTKNVLVGQNNLRYGGVKSCGCYRRERTQSLNKKENKYDITSFEYGVGLVTNGNDEFYFDLEDYEKIKQYTWYKQTNQNYIFTQFKKDGKTYNYKLHNFIMGYDISNKAYLKQNIDHINGNPLDNRKQNLRLVTRSQNNMNRSIASNNTTGVRGISYRYKRGKNIWIVNFQSKTHKLKIYKEFRDKDAAIRYRKELEEKYYNVYNRQ